MKTQLKQILTVLFIATIILVSCSSEDLKPVDPRLTSIAVQEGRYDISYTADGKVSLIQYHEGVDTDTYSFTWSEDKHKLTMLVTSGINDVTVNTFEYLDVLVNGEPKTVVYKVVYDNDGHDDGHDDGKLVRIDYINAPNQSIPSIVENVHYNGDLGNPIGNFTDATWTMSSNQLVLDYSTNNETVEVNFNNSVDAWWTKLQPEISAALFENEFDYPYFLSLKEVASITNIYDVKETPDYNDTFNYQYDGDRIARIGMNGNSATFTWK